MCDGSKDECQFIVVIGGLGVEEDILPIWIRDRILDQKQLVYFEDVYTVPAANIYASFHRSSSIDGNFSIALSLYNYNRPSCTYSPALWKLAKLVQQSELCIFVKPTFYLSEKNGFNTAKYASQFKTI